MQLGGQIVEENQGEVLADPVYRQETGAFSQINYLMRCFMRRQQKFILAAVVLSAMLFAATNSFATRGRGNTLNTVCATNDAQPYTGDCTLCHVSNYGTMTDAMTAYNAGGDTRLDYFCPAPVPPPCTDSDGDSYATEDGSCGSVDCDDTDCRCLSGCG